jgi:regulator of protease activity HflC (stomatin/prohibitin superfamily)
MNNQFDPNTILNNFFKRIQSSSIFYIIVGILFFLLFSYQTFFIYVKPNEVAIKQVKIGINRGIQEKVYTTGMHLVIPGINLYHVFPKDLQVFDLSSVRNQTSSRFIDRSAHIQTSDGFYVEVELSIVFKIIDAYKVIKTLGPGELFFLNGILPKTEPVLKETLGKLTTEEFYNPYLRVEKMNEAKIKLNSELNDKGIAIEQVLIRYFKYSDEIQRNIEEKKLKDQLIFKNRAEARAETQAAQLQKTIQEGEATILVELAKGNAYQLTKKAEEELYVRTKHAKGNLLVKEAEAYKIKLKNRALKGLGSENLVGLEMAKVLEGVQVIVLPSDGPHGVNPLNLEKTRMMFE